MRKGVATIITPIEKKSGESQLEPVEISRFI